MNNLVYGLATGKLLFSPLYRAFFYNMLFRVAAPVSAVSHMSTEVCFPAAIGLVERCSFSTYDDGKENKPARPRWVFIIIYLVIRLCYSINDVGLLLPLLIILARWRFDFKQC
jgi:hypothetical protein